VDGDITSGRSYSVRGRGLRYGSLPADGSAARATPQPIRGTSLVVIVLASLGLWAGIWAAVSSLARVWVR
jgi:hypothetical protein